MGSVLLRGFVLGFVIAASPGPIFFLCLRRTLARGWLTGVVSGIGVATGDGLYAALAAFGIGAITSWLAGDRFWLALIGGTGPFLFWFGAEFASADSRPSSSMAT